MQLFSLSKFWVPCKFQKSPCIQSFSLDLSKRAWGTPWQPISSSKQQAIVSDLHSGHLEKQSAATRIYLCLRSITGNGSQISIAIISNGFWIRMLVSGAIGSHLGPFLREHSSHFFHIIQPSWPIVSLLHFGSCFCHTQCPPDGQLWSWYSASFLWIAGNTICISDCDWFHWQTNKLSVIWSLSYWFSRHFNWMFYPLRQGLIYTVSIQWAARSLDCFS